MSLFSECERERERERVLSVFIVYREKNKERALVVTKSVTCCCFIVDCEIG